MKQWIADLEIRQRILIFLIALDHICLVLLTLGNCARGETISASAWRQEQAGRWDVIDIDGDEGAADLWFKSREGAGYDWIGLLRTVIPFFPHSKTKYFCSEACGAALGLRADDLSPQDLFDRLRPL